jgi:hypothetical protein
VRFLKAQASRPGLFFAYFGGIYFRIYYLIIV